jgi:hypothetical protein
MHARASRLMVMYMAAAAILCVGSAFVLGSVQGVDLQGILIVSGAFLFLFFLATLVGLAAVQLLPPENH